jgi:hypothetical protein
MGNEPLTSRRALLGKAVAAGAVAWVAPAVVASSAASAAAGSPAACPCGAFSTPICYFTIAAKEIHLRSFWTGQCGAGCKASVEVRLVFLVATGTVVQWDPGPQSSSSGDVFYRNPDDSNLPLPITPEGRFTLDLVGLCGSSECSHAPQQGTYSLPNGEMEGVFGPCD